MSRSRRHVIRGLHVQRLNPQGKLIRCLDGRVYDVGVDMRRDSPTFGQHVDVILDGNQSRAIYLPPGCAHGFQVLSEYATVHYKCTTRYDQSSDGGVLWSDPELRIPWPEPGRAIVSAKDSGLPRKAEYLLG